MKAYRNILFLLHLPPPIHGSSIVGLSIKESVTINKAFECRYFNLLASKNVSETGKVSIRKTIEFVTTFTKVFFSLIRKRPQLCYLALTSSGKAFYKDLLLVALLKLFRIKRVYHLHNKGVCLHQNKFFNRVCYRFVFMDAEVILLSKYLYFDIRKFVPKLKVHICPNGILDGQSETPNNKCEQTPVNILFLSNLIESKGVHVLLEACILLKKKEITFECVFVGGEGDITATQFKVLINQLELDNQVSYQGKKFGEEKKKFFSNADIFVLPTYEDCFPLVLLEASSYSLPLLSTFEGGIPDIVDDGITGFLIPQRNAEALTEKLEQLIKNPSLRKQMGAAGRKKYENEFRLEIFEKRLSEILHKVIEKGNP